MMFQITCLSCTSSAAHKRSLLACTALLRTPPTLRSPPTLVGGKPGKPTRLPQEVLLLLYPRPPLPLPLCSFLVVVVVAGVVVSWQPHLQRCLVLLLSVMMLVSMPAVVLAVIVARKRFLRPHVGHQAVVAQAVVVPLLPFHFRRRCCLPGA